MFLVITVDVIFVTKNAYESITNTARGSLCYCLNVEYRFADELWLLSVIYISVPVICNVIDLCYCRKQFLIYAGINCKLSNHC